VTSCLNSETYSSCHSCLEMSHIGVILKWCQIFLTWIWKQEEAIKYSTKFYCWI